MVQMIWRGWRSLAGGCEKSDLSESNTDDDMYPMYADNNNMRLLNRLGLAEAWGSLKSMRFNQDKTAFCCAFQVPLRFIFIFQFN